MTFKTSLEYSVTPVYETHCSQGGGVAQMVERSLSMREVPGSIPGASKTFSSTLCLPNYEKKFASSGNRTRAARVAGEHSTTEPTMLHLKDHRNT